MNVENLVRQKLTQIDLLECLWCNFDNLARRMLMKVLNEILWGYSAHLDVLTYWVEIEVNFMVGYQNVLWHLARASTQFLAKQTRDKEIDCNESVWCVCVYVRLMYFSSFCRALIYICIIQRCGTWSWLERTSEKKNKPRHQNAEQHDSMTTITAIMCTKY